MSDAIIILMGSITDRALEAADLYNEDLAREIIMVETANPEYDKVLEQRGAYVLSKTKQTHKAEIMLGIPAVSIIILPGGASSTQMEAIIIREYIKQKPGMDTLLLVTSSYHTRRASMIFKSAFKKSEMPICIATIPSKYSSFNIDGWWKSKEGIETVFIEFLKITNFILFEKRKL